MRRPIILATCAIALVAAGCGSSGKKASTTAPAGASVATSGNTADNGLFANLKQSEGPAKLDLALKVKIDGVPTAAGAAGALLSQPIQLKLSGVSDSAAKSSDMNIALDLGALALNAKLLSDGTKQWIQYDNSWYVLDTAALAGAAGGVTGNPTTTAPSVDTGKIKAALADPSRFFKDAKKVGDEKVGGIQSEHITGTLDVAKALDATKQLGGSTTSGVSPAQAQQLTDAFKDPTVDVWIGKDDRVVHRLAFKINGDFTKVADAQGLKGLSVDLDATMLPADSPKITPPANAKSSQELLMAVLGGFGPALGLGGLPTATG
jgi:hypothetical protein